MNTESEHDDKRFLMHSLQFCKWIDKHGKSFNLDPSEVAKFKSDTEVLFYLMEHYHSFTAGFIMYNIESMRSQLSTMMAACADNKQFAVVGEELGVDTPVERDGADYFNHKWMWKSWLATIWGRQNELD
jgi:hypothetical protein